MALRTGNPYLDALGGAAWPKTPENTGFDGALLLAVYFDNDTSAGDSPEEAHSTGGAWTPEEELAFWGALHAWSAVANVRFLEVEPLPGNEINPDAVDLWLRKQTNAELGASAGEFVIPGDEDLVPFLGFNVNYHWTPEAMQPGGEIFETFLHEIGHALGLEHPHDTLGGTGVFPGIELVNADGTPRLQADIENDKGDNNLNRIPFTVMSYNDDPAAAAIDARDRGFASTPLAFDIATIQRMYGLVNANTGNTVYTLRDAGSGTSFSTIWDTGGDDTIRYDGNGFAIIDLRYATLQNEIGGGGFTSHVVGALGGFTIAAPGENDQPIVVIENAVGGSGTDKISGNEFDNHLDGRGGTDTLDGRGGNDTLTGGGQTDVFVFADGWGHDRVADFQAGPGGDVLNLLDVTGLQSLGNLVGEDTADGLKISVSGDPNNFVLLPGVLKAQFFLENNIWFTQRAGDGYISGATVFADANGNGQLDGGEASDTTDANGAFELLNQTGTLIASGGVDTLTGLPLEVRLSAPEHSIVITPLTTLLVAGASQSNLRAALGLSAGFGLTLGDPIAALLTGNADGAKVFAAGAKVIDTVIAIGTAIAGLGGDEADAHADAFTVIAAAVNNLAGATLDFSNGVTIAGLFTSVAQLQGIDASPLAAAVAAAIAASNGEIDQHLANDGASAALLTNVSAVQQELQANESPQAVDDSAAVTKGKTLLGNVLANDSDPDGDAIQVVTVAGGNLGDSIAGTYGALTIEADGSYSYVANKGGLPPSGFVAQDTFHYSITDGLGGAGSATLTVLALNPDQKYQAGANTTLIGGDGKDVLDGSFGHDNLFGGNGADVLIGGPGNFLTGGNGPDTFLFRPEFGANTITDFDAKSGGDVIQIDNSVFQDLSDLLAHTSDTPSGAVIDDGAGNTITLTGVALAQLQANDFLVI